MADGEHISMCRRDEKCTSRIPDHLRVSGPSPAVRDVWAHATRLSVRGLLHDAVMEFLRLRTLLAGQLSHLLHQFPAESDTVSRPAPARCDGVGGRLRGQETGAQASGLSSSAAAVARAIDNGAKIVTGADGVIEKLLAKVNEEIRSHLRFLRDNYYAALQLSPPSDRCDARRAYHRLGNAGRYTDTLVKRNYRRLALRYHPDKTDGLDSGPLFATIRAAYDTLATAHGRALYTPRAAASLASFFAPQPFATLGDCLPSPKRGEPHLVKGPYPTFSKWLVHEEQEAAAAPARGTGVAGETKVVRESERSCVFSSDGGNRSPVGSNSVNHGDCASQASSERENGNSNASSKNRQGSGSTCGIPGGICRAEVGNPDTADSTASHTYGEVCNNAGVRERAATATVSTATNGAGIAKFDAPYGVSCSRRTPQENASCSSFTPSDGRDSATWSRNVSRRYKDREGLKGDMMGAGEKVEGGETRRRKDVAEHKTEESSGNDRDRESSLPPQTAVANQDPDIRYFPPPQQQQSHELPEEHVAPSDGGAAFGQSSRAGMSSSTGAAVKQPSGNRVSRVLSGDYRDRLDKRVLQKVAVDCRSDRTVSVGVEHISDDGEDDVAFETCAFVHGGETCLSQGWKDKGPTASASGGSVTQGGHDGGDSRDESRCVRRFRERLAPRQYVNHHTSACTSSISAFHIQEEVNFWLSAGRGENVLHGDAGPCGSVAATPYVGPFVGTPPTVAADTFNVIDGDDGATVDNGRECDSSRLSMDVCRESLDRSGMYSSRAAVVGEIGTHDHERKGWFWGAPRESYTYTPTSNAV